MRFYPGCVCCPSVIQECECTLTSDDVFSLTVSGLPDGTSVFGPDPTNPLECRGFSAGTYPWSDANGTWELNVYPGDAYSTWIAIIEGLSPGDIIWWSDVIECPSDPDWCFTIFFWCDQAGAGNVYKIRIHFNRTSCQNYAWASYSAGGALGYTLDCDPFEMVPDEWVAVSSGTQWDFNGSGNTPDGTIAGVTSTLVKV